ncbi:MAG: DUF6702 family protein [Pseudomonadales bacterium]
MHANRAWRALVRSAAIGLLAFPLGILLPASAAAHQLKAALTTVLFNERSGRLEVMHRFYLHDAEQVASAIAGRGASLLEDPEDRQRFGIYVHERFTLATADGEALPVTLRGTEIDGDYLWVYQAMRLPEVPLTEIVVSNRALRDLWPDQVNTVNVEGVGPVQTLVFRDAVTALVVRLPGER